MVSSRLGSTSALSITDHFSIFQLGVLVLQTKALMFQSTTLPTSLLPTCLKKHGSQVKLLSTLKQTIEATTNQSEGYS